MVQKKFVREREEIQIIQKFRKEDEHINLSLIALSREPKDRIGEVETAKILSEGKFLLKG